MYDDTLPTPKNTKHLKKHNLTHGKVFHKNKIVQLISDQHTMHPLKSGLKFYTAAAATLSLIPQLPYGQGFYISVNLRWGRLREVWG